MIREVFCKAMMRLLFAPDVLPPVGLRFAGPTDLGKVSFAYYT